MLKGLIYTHLGLMIKKMKMVLKLLLVEVTLTLMAVAYNHHNVFYLVDVLFQCILSLMTKFNREYLQREF